ncbi:MAG: hypothetical protein ABFD59_13190 [Smithella sp.]
MTRGPPPEKAIALALPIAQARGFAVFCKRERGSVCDIVIFNNAVTIVVRLARTKCINQSVADMEAQFAGAATCLGRIPAADRRSREIWACDYYNNLRFFQVNGTGFVEIGRDGKPVGNNDRPGDPGKKGVI